MRERPGTCFGVVLSVALTVLIGADDDWTLASRCTDMGLMVSSPTLLLWAYGWASPAGLKLEKLSYGASWLELCRKRLF